MTHFDFEDVLDEVAEARQVVKLHGVETVNQVEGTLMKTRLLWIGSSWIILDHPGSSWIIHPHRLTSHHILSAVDCSDAGAISTWQMFGQIWHHQGTSIG